jgi:hypothetical protein
VTQRERPGITPQELVACMGLPPERVEGLRVGGGKIEAFRKGWALAIMSHGEKAHWFTRDGFDRVEALCGMAAPVRWMYGQGNYERCDNCVRIMSRLIKQGRPV